jgi:hypothetical protein
MIKFPQDYAVIRTSQGYQTGRIQVLETLHKYATCFDTCTYSCVRPKLDCKTDSQAWDDANDTTMYKRQQVFVFGMAIDQWTQLTEHSKSWIYKIDRKVMISKWVSSVILKDLECVLFIGTQYSNLYTAVDTPAEAVWNQNQNITKTSSSSSSGLILNWKISRACILCLTYFLGSWTI